jgi:hypothetical protein
MTILYDFSNFSTYVLKLKLWKSDDVTIFVLYDVSTFGLLSFKKICLISGWQVQVFKSSFFLLFIDFLTLPKLPVPARIVSTVLSTLKVLSSEN